MALFRSSVVIVAVMLLAGCQSAGPSVLGAARAGLPAPPTSLNRSCPKPSRELVQIGRDLRIALDAALVAWNCSDAQVKAWRKFYASLR